MHPNNLSGAGDSQRDSRESFAIDTPIFIARQADSHESLECPIRANLKIILTTPTPHICKTYMPPNIPYSGGPYGVKVG